MVRSSVMKYLWILAFFLGASGMFAADQSAQFYFVDIGHGNVTFVVSPSGETMLLDCGPTRAADRIYSFMQQNGIKKIDYLFVTHFEDDHMGAAPALSEKVEIVNWVDHGESVTYGKSDEWWKGRRAPWFHPGAGQHDNDEFDAYKAARAKGHHIVVKPGDRVPIKGMEAIVVTGGGKDITTPLKGAGQPNAACAQVQPRIEDDAEDGQSLGLVIKEGKFSFAYFGDMDWNPSYRLFCPNNLVGHVDVYLITHHAQSFSKSFGETMAKPAEGPDPALYYWSLSCCSPAEVWGLHPRVAVLSMGAEGHKAGDDEAMKTVTKSPGLEGLWMTEKIVGGGEAGHNPPDDFIANVGGPRPEKVPAIKLVTHSSGGFEFTNMRNGFTKEYAAEK
jgi:competence protein ComEC